MTDDLQINVHPFDAEDQETLKGAYERLLAIRKDAISAMEPFISDTGYFSGVLVDALIGGVMEHFHEFVRTPDDHIREMTEWGMVANRPVPRTYIDNRVSELETLVLGLSAAKQSSPEAQPAPETDEGRDRAVKSEP
jgi:hypothetical protein